RRVARESRPVQGHFEAPDEAPAETVATLDRTRDLLLCEEVMRERPTEERRQLHEELTRLNWSLVLPLISENTVIGLIAVGPKLSGDPFYPQDLDLLMTLANQAGVAVKNAQLYARVVLANEYINSTVATSESAVAVFSDLTQLKELQEGRRRAERLSYFEMLASGIAHEIKNPLVAIKTFAQLLPRRHADAQFVEEFGRIAAREILRMERLLERL